MTQEQATMLVDLVRLIFIMNLAIFFQGVFRGVTKVEVVEKPKPEFDGFFTLDEYNAMCGGDKVSAIRSLNDRTSLGLKGAKGVVDEAVGR